MVPARAGSRPATRIRILVTDIDGTLTDGSRRLDPDAAAAVVSLEARGIPVLLATGNVLPVALAIHRSLGLSGPIVAENGGLVYDRNGGHERVRTRCDRAVALRALRKAESSGIPVRRLFSDRWRETEVAIEPTVSVRRVRQAIDDPRVLVESTGFAIHIMEAGGGKLPAVREVLSSLGTPLAECSAAGDGDNDVGILEAAGYSMSFRSGSSRARRAADYVAHRSFGQGFVEGLIHGGILPPLAGRSGGR